MARRDQQKTRTAPEERRSARLEAAVKPSTKARWAAAAAGRRWTLTTLVEVAVETYLARRR